MNKLFLVGVLFASATAFAEEAADAGKEKPIAAEAEFGLIMTSGNTESSSTTAKLDIKQDFSKWKNNYIFEAFYKEDEVVYVDGGVVVEETQEKANRFFASVQSDYKLDDEHKGIFVYASYEDDKFSGFEYQGTIAVGYSDRLFETEKSWLDYSVGPGMALAKTEESTDDLGNIIPSEETETFALRLSGSYQYNISDHAKFTQKLSSDIAGESDKNTKIKSTTGLTATINSSMALKLSYTVHHNTEPPAGIENTDTTTAVTLVFTY